MARLLGLSGFLLSFWPTELGGALVRYHFYRRFLTSSGRFNIDSGCILTGFEHLSIGRDSSFLSGSKLYAHNSRRLTIGERCSVNHNTIIAASEGGLIEIGDDVLIGPNVVIRAADHCFTDITRPIRAQGHVGGTIVIERDVWIAANTVVTAGVRIGTGCVVGAGSVVTKDLPPYSVCAGVPANVIRSRNQSQDVVRHQDPAGQRAGGATRPARSNS